MGYLKELEKYSLLEDVVLEIERHLSKADGDGKDVRDSIHALLDEVGAEDIKFVSLIAKLNREFKISDGLLASIRAIFNKLPRQEELIPATPVDLVIQKVQPKHRPRKHTPGRLYNGFKDLGDALVARMINNPEPVCVLDLARELTALDRVPYLFSKVRKLKEKGYKDYELVFTKDSKDGRKNLMQLVTKQIPLSIDPPGGEA